MNRSPWRAAAAEVISRVLSATVGQPEAEIRRALRLAYPFGERRYHPYRIWLDEVARQRGRKPQLRTEHPAKPLPGADTRQVTIEEYLESQPCK